MARTLSTVLPLARELSLTLDDAAYVELARRRGTALVTLDARMAAAAEAAGVPVA